MLFLFPIASCKQNPKKVDGCVNETHSGLVDNQEFEDCPIIVSVNRHEKSIELERLRPLGIFLQSG